MKKLFVILLASLLYSSNSLANVVYTWISNEDQAPFGITLSMEFTEQAIATGHYELDAMQLMVMPDSGLQSLYFAHRKSSRPMDIHPGDELYYAGTALNMVIDFLEDGTLSGHFDLYGAESNISMVSDGSLFTITHANSDTGMLASGCTPLWIDCTGATGSFYRLVRESSGGGAHELPEPASLGLVGLGLFGLGYRRKHA